MIMTRWILFCFVVLFQYTLQAQDTPKAKDDTPAQTSKPIKSSFELNDSETEELSPLLTKKAKKPGVLKRIFGKNGGPPKPKRAAILSAIVPGTGQIYNRRAWKTPIVWASMGGLTYGIVWNTRQYRRFRDAFRDRVNPNAVDEFCVEVNGEMVKLLSDNDIAFLRDGVRRDMELTYIGLVAVWGLNVLEAYVDAHLQNFDINDDLTFRVAPSFINPGNASAGVWGVGVKFLF